MVSDHASEPVAPDLAKGTPAGNTNGWPGAGLRLFFLNDARMFLLGLTVAFIAIVGGLWLWARKNPEAYLYAEYPIYAAKIKMLDSCSVGKLDILGSSNAVADLVPARIGEGVVNYGFGGVTPVELFYVARRIMACPSLPRAVIISVPVLGFAAVGFEAFWDRAISFGLLNYHEIEEVRLQSRLLGVSRLFGGAPHRDGEMQLMELLYSNYFPSYYMTSIIAGLHEPRKQWNAIIYQEVLKSRGVFSFGRASGTRAAPMDSILEEFKANPLTDYYFNQTLQLFASRHIPVYYIFNPYNRDAYHPVSPKTIAQFNEYLRKYIGLYPNFHVLGDPYLQLPAVYFSDNAHLNPAGALLMSDITRNILNRANVPGAPFLPQPRIYIPGVPIIPLASPRTRR